jgi:transposase
MPYVKTNKHDAADAETLCEAVCRPPISSVLIKNVEQQAVLPLHRVWQGCTKARTAQANQIRGLLDEFGLIVPQGIGHITSRQRCSMKRRTSFPGHSKSLCYVRLSTSRIWTGK